MTGNNGVTTGDLDETLMMLLAEINRHMTALWKMFYENPAVSTAELVT